MKDPSILQYMSPALEESLLITPFAEEGVPPGFGSTSYLEGTPLRDFRQIELSVFGIEVFQHIAVQLPDQMLDMGCTSIADTCWQFSAKA